MPIMIIILRPAGTPLCPASCDPAAEAAAAVGELMKADVVLTTYLVGGCGLSSKVYYYV